MWCSKEYPDYQVFTLYVNHSGPEVYGRIWVWPMLNNCYYLYLKEYPENQVFTLCVNHADPGVYDRIEYPANQVFTLYVKHSGPGVYERIWEWSMLNNCYYLYVWSTIMGVFPRNVGYFVIF